MGYKKVIAIAAMTVPCSIGQVRFDPDAEGDRYHGGIFNDEDAAKLVAKKAGEIKGEASEEEFVSYFASLSGPGAVKAAQRLKNYRSANPVEKKEGEEDAPDPLAGAKAAVSSRLTAFPDDAGPAAAGGTKTVRKIKDTLRESDDLSMMAELLKEEEAGANRDSAKAAIKARMRAVTAAKGDGDSDSDEGEEATGEEGAATGSDQKQETPPADDANPQSDVDPETDGDDATQSSDDEDDEDEDEADKAPEVDPDAAPVE